MSAVVLPALCSVTFRRLDPAAIVQLAADAKLAAIEWGGDVHVPPGNRQAASAIGEATRAAGLAVSSYGSYLAPPDATPGEIDAVLDTAQALSAPHVRIWAGRRERSSRTYSAEDREEAIRAIAFLARRAAARGLTIGLEYHPKSLTDDLASARALLARLEDEPNLFSYWQPAPGLPLDAALAEIATIGRNICHFHVFAWDGAGKRHPLATQETYWRRCRAALPADRRWTGPTYAMLEFVENDDQQAFRRDAATLRAILPPQGTGGKP